jgi:hypothetical protein
MRPSVWGYQNSIRASGQCSLQIIGSISTNSPSSTSPRTHFGAAYKWPSRKSTIWNRSSFSSSLRARPMPVVFNVLFMVLIVFFLEFGLPNTLPFCVRTYTLYLYTFPVYAHADLVRESNKRSDSLIIVVDLFSSGQPVLMHLYWCRGVGKVMPRWKQLLWFHNVKSVVLPSCESKRSGFFKCRLQANDASFHYFWLAVLPSHSLTLIRGICPLQMSHAPFWNASKSEALLWPDLQFLQKMSVVKSNDSLL